MAAKQLSRRRQLKEVIMGRKQADIDRITELEKKNTDLWDRLSTTREELAEARLAIRKIKQWVAQLPIEARVDMPELQQ